MILEALFGLITGIINLIPFELPDLPEQFYNALDFLFNGIKSSLGLLNCFIDLRFWLICAGAMFAVHNVKHIWNGFIYCLNLIPSVNISFWK